jgi:molybdopterin-binding protein
MLSARNQFSGQIKAVKLGAVAAEVVVSAGGIEIVAAITRDSAERMKLAAGDRVTAVIKASDVMIAKD